MHLRTLLFGKPLRSTAEAREQITPAQGVPTLGLDALASASYGPEAGLTSLLVAGPAASVSVVPVLGFVVLLLVILYFSRATCRTLGMVRPSRIGACSSAVITASATPCNSRGTFRGCATPPAR